MAKKSWQWRLYTISFMKKEKVRIIRSRMDLSGRRVLDIGCAQGVVSAQLKNGAGNWVHTDVDFANLPEARAVLGRDLVQCACARLPFASGSFDDVLLLDTLEHVDDDRALLAETARLLRPGGRLAISTPISGGFFLFNKLKNRFGLTPEIYGHKREGYSLAQLALLAGEQGLKTEYQGTYAKFFVEMVEMTLNVLFTRKNRIRSSHLHSGAISPTSAAALDKNPFLMRLYRYLIYPLLYLFTRLDRLLFCKTGYATLLIARKGVTVDGGAS